MSTARKGTCCWQRLVPKNFLRKTTHPLRSQSPSLRADPHTDVLHLQQQRCGLGCRGPILLIFGPYVGLCRMIHGRPDSQVCQLLPTMLRGSKMGSHALMPVDEVSFWKAPTVLHFLNHTSSVPAYSQSLEAFSCTLKYSHSRRLLLHLDPICDVSLLDILRF